MHGGGPKDGDVVLHCGHLDEKEHHFFKTKMKFQPPGTRERLTAKWIIQCGDCFAKLPKDLKKEHFTIGGHDTWDGDDPIIDNPVYTQN